jgi:hypothetical protein
MKRTVIVLFLSAVMAGSAFAQLTLSGDAYVGFSVKKPYDEADVYGIEHRKEGQPKFNFAAMARRENYGIKLDTKFQYNPASSSDFFTLNGIYGWTYFLDNSIRVSLGKISDAVWATSLDSNNENVWNFDEVTGLRAEYKTPLEGLSVGAAFNAGDQNYNTENLFRRTIFGASYIHEMFNTVAAYDLGNDDRVLLGFNFTGIEELTTAGIQLKATSLTHWKEQGILSVHEKAAYRVMRPLTVSLYLKQQFSGDSEDIGLNFIPGCSYKINPLLTASLDVDIGTVDSFKTTDLTLKPCLEYTLKGPALFYVQYELKLAEFKKNSHSFGVGMDIKAF